ncbi:MAG: T9SS type A sorting domain-containing protein, partial [Ignavibacteria bacterium]
LGGSIYAILTDKNGDYFAGGKEGVFYSTDKGITWKLNKMNITISDPSSGYSFGVTSLAINDSFLFAGTWEGVFRSSDLGKTWSQIKPMSRFGWIEEIKIHPLTGDLFVAESEGLFSSTNNGISWDDINFNHPNTLIRALEILNSGELLVGFENAGGIYKSTDSGLNWFKSDSGMIAPGANAIEQTITGDIYAGELFLYKSTNKGISWDSINSGPYPGLTLYSLESDSTGSIYAGYPMGYLLKSVNSGASWDTLSLGKDYNNFVRAINISNDISLFSADGFGLQRSEDQHVFERVGFPMTDIYDIACSPNNNIFASSYLDGLFRSVDGGNSWEHLDLGTVLQIALNITINDSGYLFCIDGLSSLIRSLNNGDSWQSLNFGQGISQCLLLNNKGYLFVNINWRLNYSTNNGDSWIEVNSELIPPWLDYDINSSGEIYAACDIRGIYKSSNDGLNWSNLETNLPTGIRINNVRCNKLDQIYIGTNEGMYISKDGGMSWDQINNGLPDGNILSLVINNDNKIFAVVKNNGLFISTDSGDHWNFYSDNTVYNHIVKIVLDDKGFLYAATEFQSVLKSIETTVSVNDLTFDSEYSLSQNRPNPFNSSTIISFSIPSTLLVTLTIFNLLGEEICTLINEEKQAGKYNLNFDAGNLSSGIYYYTLKAGNFIQSRKLILIK